MRWRIRSVLLRIAAAVITALHAGLLWRRVENLSITEPDVIVRWCIAAIAAAAALVLLQRRASWRVWLIFGIALVLLHAAALPQGVRVEVLAEAAVAIVPLILLANGRLLARPIENVRLVESERVAIPLFLLAVSLTSRAPPPL